MYILKTIGKMMRYFLLTGSKDRINLFVVGIKIYLHHLTLHIGQEHFNTLKNSLYMESLVVDQVITLNKSVMTQKRSLVTAIPNIKYNQVISKSYNAKSRSMKVLTIMKI